MMGNAILVTVKSCCCGGSFFERTLRDSGSAFGGRVLVMSEESISAQCVVRWCVLGRLPALGACFGVDPIEQRKRVGFQGGVRVERQGRMQSKSVKTANPMQVERHERAASQFSPA